jgi:hypothetical protein
MHELLSSNHVINPIAVCDSRDKRTHAEMDESSSLVEEDQSSRKKSVNL